MSSLPDEVEHIALARGGSHSAFEQAVKPYVDELRRHCYRMSASLDDADDLVQETLFRAWRGLGTYSGRSSFRTWLYRIATNRSLDVLGGRAWRDPNSDSVADPSWLQPFPTSDWKDSMDPEGSISQLESVGLSFLVTIQKLPPKQRAVLLLRDVLGYSTVECAEILESTVAAINSALQRARAGLSQSSEVAHRSATAEQVQLVEEFVSAWRSDDVAGLVSLLADDVVLTMPPEPLVVVGATGVVDFLHSAVGLFSQTKLVPIEANFQPGFAVYAGDDPRFSGLIVLETLGPRFSRMVGFSSPQVALTFDLPLSL